MTLVVALDHHNHTRRGQALEEVRGAEWFAGAQEAVGLGAAAEARNPQVYTVVGVAAFHTVVGTVFDLGAEMRLAVVHIDSERTVFVLAEVI